MEKPKLEVVPTATPGDAQDIAPNPDWSKLPSLKMVKLACGEHGIIRDTNQPIYRELRGRGAS